MSETKDPKDRPVTLPNGKARHARVRWKTQADFEAMDNEELQKYLREYKEIKRTGVLPGQGGRGLNHAEMIQLNWYIMIVGVILKKRGVEVETEAERAQ